MAVLNDIEIKQFLEQGIITITDFDMNHVDSCSVDLRLGNTFRIFRNNEISHIDIKKGIAEEFMEVIHKKDTDQFIVHPGELVLAHTKETIKMPDHLVGTLDGRSSLGRLGLIVHSTANSLDPGYEGQITLEISNIAKFPIILWPGIRVCRLTFSQLTGPSSVPYNKRKRAKYMGNEGPGRSKIDMDSQDKLIVE